MILVFRAHMKMEIGTDRTARSVK